MEKTAFDSDDAGAVSHEVAIQMAQGAKFQSDSNVSIGITGIAGPGGSTSNKEVGRVHVAVIAGDYFLSRRMISEIMTDWITRNLSVRTQANTGGSR